MEESILKVFVVDDEQSVVKALVNDVDWENYHCEIAGYTTDSQEALELLGRIKIDVLVTDIYMPCISGLELCKRARELQPDIFIIVISAYNRFEYVKEALKYEIVDYCLKPIDMEELDNCLRTVCTMQNNRLMQRKNSYDSILQNSIFQRFLREDISDPFFEEQCRLAEMDLNASYCRVFLISTAEIGKSERIDLMNAFFEKKLPGIYCFLDAYMNLVILYFSDIPEGREIDSGIRNVIRKKKLSERTFLCIGRPLKNYRQIASGYQECLDFTNARSLFDDRTVLVEKYPYEKYLSQKKMSEVFRITNYLEAGNWIAAEEFMIRILVRYTKAEEQKRELICLAVFLVHRYQGNSRGEKGIPALPYAGMKETLSSCQMKNWLDTIYKNLRDNKSSLGESLHPYVRRAISEVDGNYGDKSLSLQEIARKCGVSASYLGFLFKEQVGEYFNDYLMKKRLDTAEFLLGRKELLISEVAGRVGFSSQSYFNKVFRQKYGISPTEFRHKCRDKSDI